jgi:hypothetical protein
MLLCGVNVDGITVLQEEYVRMKTVGGTAGAYLAVAW